MMREKTKNIIGNLVLPVRILTGIVFIVSGVTKGIDPWGTIYKTNDYFNVLGISLWDNLTVSFSFFLCGFEFITGIFLLLGCFRRSWPIVALFFMFFMLPLTFWIALTDPVEDCGCFGDALKINNWATFIKNIVLTLFIIFLCCFNQLRKSWIAGPLQWLAVIISICFIGVIEFIGYSFQPLMDFRNFPEGERLVSDEEDDDKVAGFKFIYKKGDNLIEIGENDPIPSQEDGWIFQKRVEEIKSPEIARSQNDKNNLYIFDRSGDPAVDDAIDAEGEEIIVFSPELSKVSLATTWKLNMINDWAINHGIKMIAVVSASEDEIKEWEDLAMADYPIYTADDSQIKQIVRGNPSLVFLQNGVIAGKTSLKALDVDNLVNLENLDNINRFIPDKSSLLRNLVWIYLICMGFLIVASFVPLIIRLLGNKHAKHDPVSFQSPFRQKRKENANDDMILPE